MKEKYKNIVFYFFTIIFIIFISEIFFTLLFIFHQSNYHGPMANLFFKQVNTKETPNIYRIEYDKNTKKLKSGSYKSKNGVEYKVNSLGFLGEEFTIQNENNCRIISLGGSTTAGISSEKTYPEILEEKLQQNNLNCEVLNFGFPSKGLNYLENLLVNEAVNYKPNIITIMSNRNSVMYDSFGNSSVSPGLINNKFDYFIYKTDKFLFLKIMTYRFFQLSYKRILSVLHNEEDKIVNPYDPKNLHLKNYFTSKYLNQMANILNFCRLNNIKVVLIKEAHYIEPSYQKSLESLSNDEIVNKLLVYHKETNRNKKSLFWIYTNLILNNILDEIKLKNPDVVIVDPTEELYSLDKDKYFSKDGIHLTLHGNEIVADKIMQSIMRAFSLPAFSS